MTCELCSQLGRYNVEATVRVTIPMAGEHPTYRLCDDCAAEVGAYTVPDGDFVEVHVGALAAESALTQAQAENERLRAILEDAVNIVGMIDPEDDDDHDMIAGFVREARAALASVPDTTEEDA